MKFITTIAALSGLASAAALPRGQDSLHLTRPQAAAIPAQIARIVYDRQEGNDDTGLEQPGIDDDGAEDDLGWGGSSSDNRRRQAGNDDTGLEQPGIDDDGAEDDLGWGGSSSDNQGSRQNNVGNDDTGLEQPGVDDDDE